MKFREILEENKGLAEKIHKDIGINKTSITKYKSGAVVPNFKRKVEIYEFLLEYNLIDSEETPITQLFS